MFGLDKRSVISNHLMRLGGVTRQEGVWVNICKLPTQLQPALFLLQPSIPTVANLVKFSKRAFYYFLPTAAEHGDKFFLRAQWENKLAH